MTPTPRLVRITAWSFSRYTTYLQCPAKAKFLHIDKLKEPDSPAGLEGTRVHALAELAATGKLPEPQKENAVFYSELERAAKAKKVPTELVTFADEFKALRKLPVHTEEMWCFDKDWNEVKWNDWNAIWLRIKVDAHYLTQKKNGALRVTEAFVIDHKNGKRIDEEHGLQRSLYALGTLLKFPDAERVTVAHWYLKPGEEVSDVWERAQLSALKKEWLARTRALLSDTTFVPRPGDYCRWCHFRKANGGPCVF